ncbi:MAG TPA: hypothetical protein VD735_04310 [Candidatus Saccharimonadales bacterium]|nr:hypothetical protein [Candidatus Saccharimonadales bacterium]
MNNAERNQTDQTPHELMAGARLGFDISHAYVQPDGDHIRIGAAIMFAEGAGELLHAKLIAQGLTDEQIDELVRDGSLETKLLELAPDEMAVIKHRVQEVATDPSARSALEDEVYRTEREQGLTRND